MAIEPLVGVPSEYVERMWPCIEPHVARCYKKAKEHRMAPIHVLEMLVRRDAQLWILEADGEVKSIVITQLQRHPTANECIVYMVSGILPDDWADAMAQIEDWARSVGCSHLVAYMRKGFAKIVGWEEREIYCVRTL